MGALRGYIYRLISSFYFLLFYFMEKILPTGGEWYAQDIGIYAKSLKGNDRRVALCHYPTDGTPEPEKVAQANAQLIAAAPRLLNALMMEFAGCKNKDCPAVLNELRDFIQ